MMPSNFPESNCQFGAPEDLDESQVATLPAFEGAIRGGNMDGSEIVVVAWKPSAEDIELFKNGGVIYLSMIGGLAPHFLSTNFPDAVTV